MPDYVRRMQIILQAEKAEGWVIATGTPRSVKDFVPMRF